MYMNCHSCSQTEGTNLIHIVFHILGKGVADWLGAHTRACQAALLLYVGMCLPKFTGTHMLFIQVRETMMMLR